MKLRTLVLTLAVLGIPLALLVLILPITWGYGGYLEAMQPGSQPIVEFSDPRGPAYAAGLRVGQRVIPLRGADALVEDAGPVGTVARVRVVAKNGRIRIVDVPFVRFSGSLGVQQSIDKIVDALVALAAFAIAILVLMRARDVRVGSRAANVLVLAGAGALAQSGALVCGNALPAYVLTKVLPVPLGAGTLWAALGLLAIYPPQGAKLRQIFALAGPLAMLTAILGDISYSAVRIGGVSSALLLFFDSNFEFPVYAMASVLWLALAVSCIHAIVSARDAYAPPVRWLCGMWLCAIVVIIAPTVLAATGSTILFTHYGDIVYAGAVAFLAFGVAYPVLRHRMVDLNILVSRATVFTTVSLILVGLFVFAEWAIAKIFEQSFGFSNERGGVAAQLATLGVVLVLGFSARSIHGFVDRRLTNTFFRKRLKGLARIEEAAHEADASTDARAVIDIAVATVQHCLNPQGVALYLHAGNRYERIAATGDAEFPIAYDYNDVPPLKLRRWLKPFESDDDSEERRHMLFLPMLVRGDLVGFLVCGTKPDHTAYLPDEIAALSLLALHVGIAQALLNRPAPVTSLTLSRR